MREDLSLIPAKVSSIVDETRDQLTEIESSGSSLNPKVLSELKKRKLVGSRRIIVYKVFKGPKYAREVIKEETDLTSEMIARSFGTHLYIH